MTLRLLTEHNLEFISLKGDFTGWPESTLVKKPHCWKSRVAAHIGHCANIGTHFFAEVKNNVERFNPWTPFPPN